MAKTVNTVYSRKQINNIKKYYFDENSDIFNTKRISTKKQNKQYTIPTFDEYNYLIKYNYTVFQLKEICKFYKQKTTGKKALLIYNLYNYLYLSNKILKIQKLWRGFLQRKIIKCQGDGVLNRKIINNSTDFFTLESMNKIPLIQYFGFKDKDNFIYGFNVKSFWKLLKSQKKTENPYNRIVISKNIITRFNNYINLCKILKLDLVLEEKNELNYIDAKRQIELRAINVFQNIDLLGNYSNPQWLLSLEKNNLIKFLRELQDIWFYRAQLTNSKRLEICPPNGNPFTNIYGVSIDHFNSNQLFKQSLSIMEKIVNNGIDQDAKYLGASYVLAALTLVNNDAANSLPWLFQSVVHNNN